ncbi:MAG: cytochrome b [Deltaproteobacteria bacterium HGW-Deltaproteobacteria-14]|jgi:cytochrome b|nr:MAG: cytochrome b [Deltaproteobacteria bacterium HGW-Deltaproteobacteria-14]
MKRILVWDLPTRLFHWLLAGGFIAAFVIANVAGHRDALFPVHMLVGLSLAFMVVLRLVWGFVGTRYARFRSFLFGPKAVLGYLRGVASGTGERHIGHNPGSSMAIFAFLALFLGLAVTGILMGGGSEAAEDVHELLAYALLVTAIAHVLGIALHTWRHRENIAKTMVDGHKEGAPDAAITGAKPVIALVFIALTGLFAWRVVAGYDATTKQLTLPLIGQTLQLGKVEGEGEHGGGHHDDHDDDDD